jgi:hypothetical protein
LGLQILLVERIKGRIMGINEHHPEVLRVNSQLDELANLEFNWNGYGAGPVGARACLLASDIVEALIDLFPEGWHAVPGDNGDVALELHVKGLDLEIHVGTYPVED